MEKYEQFICSLLRGEENIWPKGPEFQNDEFITYCLDNGVGGLVYHQLKNSGDLEIWQQAILERLKKHFWHLSALELRKSDELAKLLQECSKRRITPLLLKGGGLAFTCYPHPELRERCDTDLFISVDDIQSMIQVMWDLGYSISYPVYKSHQFSCVKKNNGGVVNIFDVHWRISNYSRFAGMLSFDEALHQAVSIPSLPGNALTLGKPDALLLSCVHLLANPAHHDSRLIWIYDIHLLVTSMQSDELNWFAHQAVARQVQDVCHTALAKSIQLFNTKVPVKVMEFLSAPLPASSYRRKLKQSNMGLVLDDLIILPGLRQKLAFAGELFFPPKEYLFKLYGRSSGIGLPWLYARHIIGGMGKRLALK